MLGFSCLMGAWRASGWAGGLLTDLGVNEIFFLEGFMWEVRPARMCDGERLFLILGTEVMCCRAVLDRI